MIAKIVELGGELVITLETFRDGDQNQPLLLLPRKGIFPFQTNCGISQNSTGSISILELICDRDEMFCRRQGCRTIVRIFIVDEMQNF